MDEKKKPTNKDYLELHQALKGGITDLLRLRQIRQWVDEKVGSTDAQKKAAQINAQARKDVEELIEGVTKAVKEYLGDPERIKRFIKNLASGPEERDYAIRELYRSGAPGDSVPVTGIADRDAG